MRTALLLTFQCLIIPTTLLSCCYYYSPWGEHEIDYVLFFCVRSKDEITVKPHPDEVDAVKWVTRQQLIDMMEDPKLLFSPWFRLICKRWLLDLWWKDLQATMTTNKYCDYAKTHCFDPPKGTFSLGTILLHIWFWLITFVCLCVR
jgi:hypothetical protein